MSESIAKQLYNRRRELSIYQKQIAEACGTSQQHYQRIEKTGSCKIESLERICGVMNLEIALIPAEKAELIQLVLDSNSPESALRAVRSLLNDSEQIKPAA